MSPLWMLAAVILPLSLVSLGGGLSVLPAIQHQAVDVQGWVSGREFVDIFAVSRLAPGPGSMIVSLLGWRVAGWPGAIVATLAMFVPSSILCYAVTSVWSRYEGRRWHAIIQDGLAPLGAGLMGGGMIALTRLAGFGPAAWFAAALSAGVFFARPRTPPMLVLAISAAAFAFTTILTTQR